MHVTRERFFDVQVCEGVAYDYIHEGQRIAQQKGDIRSLGATFEETRFFGVRSEAVLC